MATISLRGYVREIDTLIEGGQVDEAIAHCRHILQGYPKHLSTYRLLGKAYLESQRHGDAADVLQRVLSAIPDDFLAHLGLSIVREDEGNLDAAIWHMERAFETQPSNAAVQSELRRLYAVRDGNEPVKIQLTSGALARMYIKGNLLPQAIAELRTALRDDPQRIDLQVVLARAYALASQRLEAVETCSNILNVLPYCFEANQILAEILPGTERAEEARIYLDRVEALDPYWAFVPAKGPTSEHVPDSMVAIERLDWIPGEPYPGMSTQPDWATSLGVEVDEEPGGEEAIPAWLAALSNEAQPQRGEDSAQESVPPFAQPLSESDVPTEPIVEIVGMEVNDMKKEPDNHEDVEHTPEGMEEGLQEPTVEAGDTPTPAFDLSADEEEGEELAAKWRPEGETPEWLKNLTPFPEEGKRIDTGALPWLDKIPPGEEDNVADWLNQTKAKYVTGPLPSPDTEEGAQIPDWLRSLIEETPEGAPQEDEAEAEPTEGEPVGVSESPEVVDEVPEAVAEPGAMDSVEEEPPDEEIPGWLREYEQTDLMEGEEVPEVEAVLSFEDEAQSDDQGEWSPESGAADLIADQEEAGVRFEDQVEEPEEEEPEIREEEYEQSEETKDEPELEKAEIPPWLETAAPEEAEIPEGEEALPDWLFEMEEEAFVKDEETRIEGEPAEFPEPEVEEEIIVGDTQPIKVQAGPEASAEEHVADEGIAYEEAEEEVEEVSEVPPPDEEEEKAAIAWLEGLVTGKTPLSGEPSEEEEVLLEASQETDEELSMALDQEVETVEAEEEVAEEAPQEMAEEMMAAMGQEAEVVEVEEEVAQEAVPEMAEEMLAAIGQKAEAIEEEEEIDVETVEIPTAQEVPDWLKEMPAEDQVIEVEPEVEVILEESTQPEVEPVTAVPELPDLDEAWRAIENGDIEAAVRDYLPWIKAEKELARVIQELDQAISRFPQEISLHEALGDACVRANRIQEALDAYTKAEELLQ